jgi:hypothetical protein
MIPGYLDALEGVTIGDVGPSSRVLIWAFRNIASGRGCDARLAMGLSSVVEPGCALECAQAVRGWLNAVMESSGRDFAFGGLPHRGVTWDEIGLLTMIAAGARNQIAYAIWWRRMGGHGAPLQRLQAIAIAEFLKLHGERIHIPGVTDVIVPRHEPEALSQARAPDAPRKD